MGSFILIDPITNATVAAAGIIERGARCHVSCYKDCQQPRRADEISKEERRTLWIPAILLPRVCRSPRPPACS